MGSKLGVASKTVPLHEVPPWGSLLWVSSYTTGGFLGGMPIRSPLIMQDTLYVGPAVFSTDTGFKGRRPYSG